MDSSTSSSSPASSSILMVPLSSSMAVTATGCLTVVLASALAYVLLLDRKQKNKQKMRENNAAANKLSSADTAKEMEIDSNVYPNGIFTIYFATQTGTSESFAREMEREAVEYGFYVHVVDLEDLADNLSGIDKRSVFLCATYGEGEAPDNAQTIANILQEHAGFDLLLQPLEENANEEDDSSSSPNKKTAKSQLLSHVEYSVFGLGNKQYDHYNAMGKFFDASLEAMGAKRIVPLGLGDDDDDLEADFENWKDNVFWPAIMAKYGTAPATTTNGDSRSRQQQQQQQHKLPDCPLKVIYHDDDNNEAATTSSSITPPVYELEPEQIHSSSRHYFTAVECPVIAVRELLTTDNSKNDVGRGPSTVHIEIDISKARPLDHHDQEKKSKRWGRINEKTKLLEYTTADNLGVIPVNDPAIVDQVAQSLEYDLDRIFSVQAATNHEWHGAPFPMPITIRDCLSKYCDLTGPPRRSDLKLLANYCPTNSVDQKALLRLSSKEGRHEYKEKILEGYVGLADLLKLCPSIHIPLEHFLNVCPPLQTRYFTISSSSSVFPHTVHLTAAVTNHERKDGSWFHGVCSNHLATSQTKYLRVFNRSSTFRLPNDATRPILMIGPGTGLAPMRALLQERQYQKQKLKKDIGTNILYFGCKKASQDYIYKDELEKFQKDGILDHLRVAFSREQTEKVYVQHLLKQHAAETWNVIDQEGGHIYVCGGVKMGHDVSETLKEIIADQGKMSTDKAAEYLSRLSHDGRFIQELWA